ncbi:MAG: hypothetical protein IPN29_09100 [Saprospiraceae bacterium]|nr:hypothetical protein [Saprospiraceae bacterium]
MKLRIKGNSIRLRLTKTEVETLSNEGYFEEHTSIGNQKLTYALKAADAVDLLSANYRDNTITVLMNTGLSQNWTSNEVVGYRHIEKLETGEELFLLVEKDFVCLEESFEDQSDNYPNPNASC